MEDGGIVYPHHECLIETLLDNWHLADYRNSEHW